MALVCVFTKKNVLIYLPSHGAGKKNKLISIKFRSKNSNTNPPYISAGWRKLLFVLHTVELSVPLPSSQNTLEKAEMCWTSLAKFPQPTKHVC